MARKRKMSEEQFESLRRSINRRRLIDAEEACDRFEKGYEGIGHQKRSLFPDDDKLHEQAVVSARNHYKHFDAVISSYAESFTKKLKDNVLYRRIYFYGSVSVLAVLVVVLILCIFLKDPHESGETFATALISFLTAFIVLPITITKSLFNPEETLQINEIIKTIQMHDQVMTKPYMSKGETDNKNSDSDKFSPAG